MENELIFNDEVKTPLTEDNSLVVEAFALTQPIGEFYVCRMPAKDVIRISKADVREMKDSLDDYLGIQRHLDEKRVHQIGEFVRTTDAAFPTGVILHVESGNAVYDREKRVLLVRDGDSIARILDGQHRLAGLIGFDGVFDLNVIIFVGTDIAEQAFIFATINLAQTKVNKSLVYDLLEYETNHSPQKTAHTICRAMHRTVGSPFHERIKVLGVASADRREVLTQASFVEELLRHISGHPVQDRELLKRHPRTSLQNDPKRIFRRLFMDGKDTAIGACVWAYFSAVSERWPDAWRNLDAGNLMVRTTGFKAFMRFLGPAYLSIKKEIPSVSEFRTLLDPVNLTDNDFTRDTQQYGNSGPSALYKALLAQSGIEVNGQPQNSLFPRDQPFIK